MLTKSSVYCSGQKYLFYIFISCCDARCPWPLKNKGSNSGGLVHHCNHHFDFDLTMNSRSLFCEFMEKKVICPEN
jgi:SUMO ligase MMS21 Smc5/6 complex component